MCYVSILSGTTRKTRCLSPDSVVRSEVALWVRDRRLPVLLIESAGQEAREVQQTEHRNGNP